MVLGLLFMIERVVTVWCFTFFATFLNIVFLKGVFDILVAKQAQWSQTDAAPVSDQGER